MKNAKKFLSLAMVLMMVLSLAPMAVYAETTAVDAGNTGNLLRNGGFEETPTEAHKAPEWDYASSTTKQMLSTAGTDAFIVTKDTEGAYVHSENNALKLVNSTSGTVGRWISQEVKNLTPGKAYRASAWVYIDGTLDKGLSLRIQKTKSTSSAACLAASSGVDRSSGVLKTTNSTWKNLSCVFVPSVDETAVHINVQFGYQSTSGKAVNVYVDDMVFEEISDINGSFEDTETIGDTTKLWAKGWSTSNGNAAYVTWIGEHAFVAANEGQNDTNALCLTTTEEASIDDEGNPEPRQLHAYIPVTGLKTGSAYKIRCYVRTSLPESVSSVSLNVAGGSGLQNFLQRQSWGGTASAIIAKNSGTTPTNLWQELSVVFTAEDTYAFIGLAAPPMKNECIYFDDVTIEETNVCFTNADGIVLGEPLSGAGDVNAKATVIGASGDTACVFVGVYETDKVSGKACLVDMYVSDTVTLGTTKWADVTIEDISLAPGQYAKAMLLDGAASLKPLADAKTITVNTAS